MKESVIRSVVVLVAGVFVATSGRGADIPVSYTVNDTLLRREAVAGTLLTFDLYSDGACSGLVNSQSIPIEDPALIIERLKRLRVRGAPSPGKVARLNLLITGVPPQAELFLKVTGTGISPVGGVCQPQFATIVTGGGGSGDITAVIAGNGLSGGGVSGDATLDVSAPLCSNTTTDKLLWTGAAFQCGADQTGGGGGGMPAGAVILWDGGTCPPGYTRVSALDGKFLVADATFNAAAGGSTTKDISHTHDVGSYTIPSHQHVFSTSGIADRINQDPRIRVGVIGGFLSGSQGLESGPAVEDHTRTDGGGSGVSGTSGVGGSAALDVRPLFATILLCKKD